MIKPRILDFFCGAGGFSEGFRQMGYEIIHGYDSWKPAIDTFNHNFELNCEVKNILDFKNSIEEIESLPNTEVIIGSPPCVSFSSSNKSGGADKSLGVELTEIFLRIIAVKKHQANSILKAWFMENVTNSVKYLNERYTFSDLNLTEWAINRGINPNDSAIVLTGNQLFINSADFGSPQTRHRVISGEFVETGISIEPSPTHKTIEVPGGLPVHNKLSRIKKLLPSPSAQFSNKLITDPLYPEIKIKSNELSDHFYDNGLFESEWQQTKYLKVNHPYMGKMSFPENEEKPSRTITATKIGTSREAIIYKSEYRRIGDGEFRTPTVREAACIMGFPITFQFLGSEGIKYKLVGNAVCPSVSRAFAKLALEKTGFEVPLKLNIVKQPNLNGVENLNTYKEKEFSKPPKRNKGSRFRRHPFKDGNLTVSLSNYNIGSNSKNTNRWFTSIQYGNGVGFPTNNYPNYFYKSIESIIENKKDGNRFLEIFNNGFFSKIGKKRSLQEMYELQKPIGNLYEPTRLIDEIKNLIESFDIENEEYTQDTDNKIFRNKQTVPLKQLFALYALNKISTYANQK